MYLLACLSAPFSSVRLPTNLHGAQCRSPPFQPNNYTLYREMKQKICSRCPAPWPGQPGSPDPYECLTCRAIAAHHYTVPVDGLFVVAKITSYSPCVYNEHCCFCLPQFFCFCFINIMLACHQIHNNTYNGTCLQLYTITNIVLRALSCQITVVDAAGGGKATREKASSLACAYPFHFWCTSGAHAPSVSDSVCRTQTWATQC